MRVFQRFPHDRARIAGCSLAVALMLAAGNAAAADDLTGQASIIDGDTLEITETVSGYVALMLRKAVSFVGATIACISLRCEGS